MSKIEQPKIPVSIPEESYYVLVRKKDGLTKQSSDVRWVEFDEQGRVKVLHEDIQVGRSLLMSPFNVYFTWMTTLVTEIVSQTDDEIEFKTQNSDYRLSRHEIV